MENALPHLVVKLAEISGRSEYTFDLTPDAPARAALAQDMGLRSLRKLRFEGHLVPQGRSDWRLEATLGATVVQDCVVSFEPVMTRIDEKVLRRYVAKIEALPPGEIEMPEDDTVDPLPVSLDIAEVMAEALSLALPPFPRAPGASLGEIVVTQAGAKPMTQEDARPFAGLDALKKALEKKDDPGEGPQ
jgi:uncharacterized metal-binding protein YceD (DUF177 family)